MKAQQVVALLVALLALTQASPSLPSLRCEEGDSYHDGCNRCMCVDGAYLCTMRACPPKVVSKNKWCQGDDEGGWLEDCHWCKCDLDLLDLAHETAPVAVCTREESCLLGTKEWPECSGNVSWQQDCNTCHCTKDGKAACTKKLCFPQD